MSDFGARLKELRTKEKLSQTAVGKIAGVTDRAIRRFETGENSPNLSVLTALADYFHVDLDYITGRSDYCEQQPSEVSDPPAEKKDAL